MRRWLASICAGYSSASQSNKVAKLLLVLGLSTPNQTISDPVFQPGPHLSLRGTQFSSWPIQPKGQAGIKNIWHRSLQRRKLPRKDTKTTERKRNACPAFVPFAPFGGQMKFETEPAEALGPSKLEVVGFHGKSHIVPASRGHLCEFYLKLFRVSGVL